MPPTRPLLIWALIASVCAAILIVEGVMLLSGRQRRAQGWRLGALLIVGSLVASALAARLSDIHAELIRTQCNCEPFQPTDPRIATPIALATLLGSALLLLTVYGGVRALTIVRYPAAPVTEGGGASAGSWSFSGSLFLLAVMADVGAWITANGVTRLTETAYLIDPARQGDSLGVLPLFDAITASLFGALLLLIPLGLMLGALRRSGRAVPGQ